jgi:uncharacterized protein
VGGDAPRGLSFVFNKNRINVATSRAQCRVELVCSPRLLEADCKTVDEMRLVNALCRFLELANVSRAVATPSLQIRSTSRHSGPHRR